MAGLSTEVCLAQTVLGALKDGYEVYFLSDCSAGMTEEGHKDAKVRMVQAGAKPVNWAVAVAEWAPDYTSPARLALTEPILQHGSAMSLAFQYVMDQISARVVPAPEFLASAAA
jgi:hypothetical protein